MKDGVAVERLAEWVVRHTGVELNANELDAMLKTEGVRVVDGMVDGVAFVEMLFGAAEPSTHRLNVDHRLQVSILGSHLNQH